MTYGYALQVVGLIAALGVSGIVALKIGYARRHSSHER